MYRTGLESILGLRLHGDTLAVAPSIPSVWRGYSVEWRAGETRYHVEVSNPSGRTGGVGIAELDGEAVDPQRIPLARDGKRHDIRIVLGEPPANGRAPGSATAVRVLF